MGNFSITDLFKIILKRLHIIVIVALLCGSISVGYCMYIAKPIYAAKTSLFADNGGITSGTGTTSQTENGVKSTDVASSLNLLNTYVGILEENDFYIYVNDYLKSTGQSVGYTDSELKKLVTISGREDTMLLDITVKCENGEFAVDLANAIVEKAPEYIKGFVPQATAKKSRTANNYSKVSPNITLTSIITAFLGACLCAVIIVVRALNDQTVKGEEDFAEKFDIPVLGSVPNFDLGRTAKGKGGYIND